MYPENIPLRPARSISRIPVSSDEPLRVAAVLVDYQENPLTIDTAMPAFSWRLESPARATRQTAYRLLVLSCRAGAASHEVWDTGRVESVRSVHLRYAGAALESNRDYACIVTVWDNHGHSATGRGRFSTALIDSSNWTADWIGAPAGADAQGLLLRREFMLSRQPVRARLFSTGVGYYEPHLNGAKVGDAVLAPGHTDCEKQVLYDVTDVTAQLGPGANVLGILLGNGWFNPPAHYLGWRMQASGLPRARLQLHLDYADDSFEVVGTDDAWTCHAGPITADGVYDGETHDARREPTGWDRAGFIGAGWAPAGRLDAPGGELRAQRVPCRVSRTLRPVRRLNPVPGVYVFDFGQNFAGWTRITVEGKAGTTMILRHAEQIGEDGSLDPRTNRAAKNTDAYTLRGGGRETWEPRFTYHGFQYVEVTGWPGEPSLDEIEGRVVHDDASFSGEFDCDNALLNHIHRCTVWSLVSNLQGGVQTDCPQRDERLGWLADAHVTADAALCNFDLALFHRKWLRDMELDANSKAGAISYVVPRKDGGHSVDWSAGYLIIAWSHYLHYGDAGLLADHYASFCRYVAFLEEEAGKTAGGTLPATRYGDWLNVASDSRETSGWQRGTPELTATGYYYYCADLLRKIAGVLGQESDVRRYGALTEKIAADFNRAFFDAAAGIYRSEDYQFQFAQIFPLFLGLVPEAGREDVFDRLVSDLEEKGHLTTGILGTRYLPDVLMRGGRVDLVHALVTRSEYPGWHYMLQGRTTLSESWNRKGSGNHPMFGSIDGWLYQSLAGLAVSDGRPGYAQIVVRPYIAPEMTRASAVVNALRGRFAAGWKKIGDRLEITVEVPANSEALVHIPADAARQVREGTCPAEQAEGVTFVREEASCAIFLVGSGQYVFSAPLCVTTVKGDYRGDPALR